MIFDTLLDFQFRLGFKADSSLGLIVEWPVKTTIIQIDSHCSLQPPIVYIGPMKEKSFLLEIA
jgi:hypothetical protein